MARHTMISDFDFTKTQLAVFAGVLLLAVDSINIHPWHIATISIALIIYVFISEMKNLLYFTTKIFFHSILSIFFRSVEVVGKVNIPRYGPVIFVGNHANQFVDGISVLCTCEHKISYLIAEASWKRRVIGDLAWALDAVPVKRAQDTAKKGTGKIVMKRIDDHKIKVTGTGTLFETQLKLGDKIRPPGTAVATKITSIASETEMEVDAAGTEHMDLSEEPVPFDVLSKIDHKVVFGKVIDKLASNGAIGIFPEGGSHDRTDLLPLKVGVALIAYSAMEKDGLSVPIVPVGLNYFQRQKFRGRAIVEYGRPIYLDSSTLSAYKEGGDEKRRVCNELLSRIEDGMKSVIVTSPDYETLQLILTARRLWQQKELQTAERQDISRRFAEGYKQLMLHFKLDPPPEWKSLHSRVADYQKELNELGIRDYQVPGLNREQKEDIQSVEDIDADTVLSEMRLPYQIAHLLCLILLAGIPSIFLNLPVGLIARRYAERRRKKALAKSKVKIKAEDVLMTEKIVICIVLVPTFWVMYAILLRLFSDLDNEAIGLFFFFMPLSSYMSIMWAEAGMVEVKDLKPYIMRLFPSSRRRIVKLPETRRNLQRDLRAYIRTHKKLLGDLYYGKEVDWTEVQSKTKRMSAEIEDLDWNDVNTGKFVITDKKDN